MTNSCKIKKDLRPLDLIIEKKLIRRYVYMGSILIMIILISILTLSSAKILRTEYTKKIEQLSKAIIYEKKVSMKNSIDQVIYLIETEKKLFLSNLNVISNNIDKPDTELQFKNYIKPIIRDIRLGKNNYIWINELLNDSGGDNYAKRFMHANLPETEGVLLSTKTQDTKGNKPYKMELDGINTSGQVYYEYYFKELNSNNISHKMSYAKLYKPYNWIIATGIYMDEVDIIIENEKKIMLKAYKKQLFNSILITTITTLFSLFLLIILERQIRKLITSYETRININTNKIMKLNSDLHKLSTTDQLTNTGNRRQGELTLKKLISNANRYNDIFTLAALDLDNFKIINDMYGHLNGDIYLKFFTKIISSNIRECDYLIRFGGDEFIIIFPKTNSDQVKHVIEKIYKTLKQQPCEINDKVLTITVSIGVTEFKIGEHINDLFERVDNQLYKSKESGRNMASFI